MRYTIFSLVVVLASACSSDEDVRTMYDTTSVERRTIEVSVSSAGVVEPLATVEVKSKASGEVLELMVDTGDHVEAGTLMVHIDPRIVRNRLNQMEAELKAALSRREIAVTQMNRALSLLEKGTFTEADVEQSTLDLANAEAQVVTAEVNVENARIAVDDTDIRAPVTGTIINKPVEKGQVISSPTQDVSGGTMLMQMADLSAVQIRALVDETDIGKIRAGMPAKVSVAAYPNQPFPGDVVKIEPLAVVEQNVTMFAVLISIQNPDGLLMPGMNAEVDVSIARSDNALSVPVMALRTERDVATTAGILNMSEADLRAALSKAGGAKEDSTIDSNTVQTIEIGGRTINLPGGVDAETVRRLMLKRRNGGALTPEEQQLLRGVLRSAGGAVGDRNKEPGSDYRFGGSYWVVIKVDGEPAFRNVRTGVTDLDRVEILEGLDLADTVLILPSAHLVETQQDLQRFINRRVGGVPGIQRR